MSGTPDDAVDAAAGGVAGDDGRLPRRRFLEAPEIRLPAAPPADLDHHGGPQGGSDL
jgi:hypothetical protein